MDELKLEPGWLDRQIKATQKEVAEWPASWKLDAEKTDTIDFWRLKEALELLKVQEREEWDSRNIRSTFRFVNGADVDEAVRHINLFITESLEKKESI